MCYFVIVEKYASGYNITGKMLALVYPFLSQTLSFSLLSYPPPPIYFCFPFSLSLPLLLSLSPSLDLCAVQNPCQCGMQNPCWDGRSCRHAKIHCKIRASAIFLSPSLSLSLFPPFSFSPVVCGRMNTREGEREYTGGESERNLKRGRKLQLCKICPHQVKNCQWREGRG